MDYCAPIGLAHSTFLGWSTDDQDKAVAWALLQKEEAVASAARCQQCGTLPSDWLDEEGRDRMPPPYIARTELCVGCHVLEDTVQEIPEAARRHTHVYLVPYTGEDEE